MADGGKRADGILKEKRACNPDVGPASAFGVATRGEDERAEKKVRKMGRKIKQNARRIRRGGLMLIKERNEVIEELSWQVGSR